MRNSLLNKKFPSLLGISILVVATLLTGVMTKNTQSGTTGASLSPVPQNIQVSNITDTSFTVTYTTQSETVGSMIYGQTPSLLSTVVKDDRDIGSEQTHTVHTFTVRNSTPNSTYYYSLVSNGTTYANHGSPYITKTGITLPGTTQQLPITGKIIAPDGKPLSGVLVSVLIPNAQVLSTLTQNDGTYLIQLSSLRSADLSTLTPIGDQTTLALTATNGVSSATATILGKNHLTVPSITLSQTYDFTSIGTNTQSTHVLSAFPLAANTDTTSSILTLKDNATLTDPQPIFRGKVNPNSTVVLTLSPSDITQEVTAGQNGDWQFQPSTPLALGRYTVSVTGQDPAGGAETTIKRSFSLLQSGSQVGESATPSATPTIIEIGVSNTPVPTIGTGVTPTIILTPTGVVGITGTAAPTPTPQPLPSSGNNIVVTTGAIGAVITCLGILLFVL